MVGAQKKAARIRGATDSLLPPCWTDALKQTLASSEFEQLLAFVDLERSKGPVFPCANDVFAAFWATRFLDVRAVVLGQDPYHDTGQAQGLAFSVPEGQRLPPSLRNIYKELATDLGVAPPTSGDLHTWAQQGLLLLNTVLTVRAHAPGSHAAKGWEVFTDAVLQALNQASRPLVFVLWGAHAQRKQPLIQSRHVVLASAHPSPLSARRGFFGSRPFSAINQALQKFGSPPIDWVASAPNLS